MVYDYLHILRKKVLSDCLPKKAFWVCSGSILRNIYELASVLKTMSDDTFAYHVNDDNGKNDFARWIREVLADDHLTDSLEKVRDRETYLEIIQNRISELEKA